MARLPPDRLPKLDEKPAGLARAMQYVNLGLNEVRGDLVLTDLLLRHTLYEILSMYGSDFRLDRFAEVVKGEWPVEATKRDTVAALLPQVVETSPSGTFVRFTCSIARFKARSINDLAFRLAHLFLLAQARINRREEVAAKELSDFLRDWHVWTNNTQAKIKRCDTIRRETGYVRLTRMGVAQAEQYLEEMFEDQREGRLTDADFFRQTANSLIRGDTRLATKEEEGRHDALVIYNSQDATEAGRLVLRLLERGIRPWFDALDLRPSDTWLSMIESKMSEIGLVVSLYGEHGIGPVQGRERMAAWSSILGENGRLIWVILPSTKTAAPEIPLFDRTLVRIDMRKDNDGIDRLVDAIQAG